MEPVESENERTGGAQPLGNREFLANIQAEFERIRTGAQQPEEGFISNRPASSRLCFSNFLITVNSNETGRSNEEFTAITTWLLDCADDLFSSLGHLRTIVLKHPTSTNDNPTEIDVNRLLRIRSKIALEQGLSGKLHLHILLEVNHIIFTDEVGRKGVHVNVRRIREFLLQRLPELARALGRETRTPYVNVRLLTRANDEQGKWLAYQYINKEAPPPGATREEQQVAAAMRRPQLKLEIRGGELPPIDQHDDLDVFDGGVEFNQDSSVHERASATDEIYRRPRSTRNKGRFTRAEVAEWAESQGLSGPSEWVPEQHSSVSDHPSEGGRWGVSSSSGGLDDESSKGKGELDEPARPPQPEFVRAESPEGVARQMPSVDPDTDEEIHSSSEWVPGWRARHGKASGRKSDKKQSRR